MRARAVLGGILSSVVVLVIGWQVGGEPATTSQQTSTSDTTGSGGSATSGSSGGSGTSGSSSSSSASTSGSSKSGTFLGTVAQTRYGPVQVQIVVSGGVITDVTAPQLTDAGGRWGRHGHSPAWSMADCSDVV
jgi:hypothetical protein